MYPLIVWAAIVHFMGVDFGVAYGHWIWYNFWSGIAGSFLVGLLAYFFLFYWHHTCHESWRCLRIGKYEAAGGMFKMCYKHHPDLCGVRPHHELIAKLHREHRERITASTPS